MDKLIKSDDLIAVFAEKAKEWRGNKPLPSMESLMWDAAVSLTENAPTIDAIPVEWITEIRDLMMCGDASTREIALFLNDLIVQWRIERDAHKE